jgi:hypothetical protein
VDGLEKISQPLAGTESRIIGLFTARWQIETTFQEMRAHLGFETPRQRVAKSVLRTARACWASSA